MASRHASAGTLLPANASRRARRAAVRASAAAVDQLTADQRARAAADRRMDREERRAANQSRTPRLGSHAPMSGRVLRRFRLPAHRATTATLAGAYPFLAERGLGADGIYIGENIYSGSAFCYDARELYRQQTVSNTNMLVAGNIGWGKSSTVKALALRSIAFGRRVFVPGDPKDEWLELAASVGGQAIRLGRGLPARMNPLDGGTPPPAGETAEWRAELRVRRLGLLRALIETVAPKLAPLDPQADSVLGLALDSAVADTVTPTLGEVAYRLANLDVERATAEGYHPERLVSYAEPLYSALVAFVRGELAGLFDGPSTVRFDPELPMVAIGSGALGDDRRLLSLVLMCSAAWMTSTYGHAGDAGRLCIYDEAWRMLGMPSQLERLNADFRLSRRFGIDNIVVVHALSDVDKVGAVGSGQVALARGLVSMCDTRVVFRQAPGELDRTAKDLALTSTETEEVARLGKGEALWKVGKRHAFLVRTRRTDLERRLFDTDAAFRTDAEGQP